MSCTHGEKKARLAERRGQWDAIVEKALTRFPERRENFVTTSGIEMKRLFTPEDVEGLDYVDEVGFPGMYPFTRGVQPTMYRARFWTMRQ